MKKAGLMHSFRNLFYSGIIGAVALFSGGGLEQRVCSQEAALATKYNLDLPFDALGESEDEEEAPEIIIFYGQQFEADGFFFCCDKSGSMRDANKFKRLQREVTRNISQFSERVQYSVVFFDKDMVKFPQSGIPADATPVMKAAGIAMVMGAQPGTGTCCKPALTESLNYARKSTVRRKTIIYLSDGRNTCPGNDEAQYKASALSEITSKNTERVRINTICIGPQGSVDEDFMKRLASVNNGTYSRIVQ